MVSEVSSQPSFQMQVSVKTDAEEVAKFFGLLGRRHIPFAFERAFRALGIEAQKEVREELPKRFVLRGQRVSKGVQYWYTKRSAWPNMQVEIGSRDEFMALQETGGTKRPAQHRMLAVPTLQVRRGHTISGRIPKAFTPKRLMQSGRGEINRKRATVLMWLKQRGVSRPAYVLARQAKLQPRFGLRTTVEGVVQLRFGKLFTDAMWYAIKTAK